MSLSLYEAVVPPMRQTVGSIQAVLDKGAAHCAETGGKADDLLTECIHETMLPLTFQLNSVIHHSIGAIEGVAAGEFNAVSGLENHDYAGFQAALEDTAKKLAAVKADDLNSHAGKDVVFRFREMAMPFTAEGFLLSFSKPNLYFHATTAYDILRMKGVPLGKRDFLGALQLKG
ncbi:MAG: DUF1993 domain-containing protein [Henriciella sp.]